jgi:hypothetical protein
MKQLTLKEWFYFQKVPGIYDNKKLQRWTREGRIVPQPIKHGREYFVEPTAKLVRLEKSKVSPHLLKQAKSDATKLMYLDRETVLSHLLATIG